MTNYFIATYCLLFAEFSAFIVGVWQWKKLQTSILKLFVVYLGFSFITELVAFYFGFVNHPVNQILMEYIAIPSGFLFFYWLIQTQISFKKGWLLFSILYLLAWLVDAFYLNHKISKLFIISYSVGTLLLIIQLLLYFYQFILSEKILNFKSNSFFWIFTGVFCFQIITFPFYLVQNLLNEHSMHVLIRLWFIIPTFIIVMNIFFIIGLLCKPNQK